MLIGERLKALRIEKNMPQGDIEKHTGLLRCYISRVENGHTIPAVQTLEKIARALEVPMYQLFFAGKPEVLKLAKSQNDWGSSKDAEQFGQFRRAIRKIKKESDLHLLVHGAKDVPEVRTHRQKIDDLVGNAEHILCHFLKRRARLRFTKSTRNQSLRDLFKGRFRKIGRRAIERKRHLKTRIRQT
jgi:transcriptional regulator with XRE-family HTH domain